MTARELKAKIHDIPDDASVVISDGVQTFLFDVRKKGNTYSMDLTSESSDDDVFDPISKFSGTSEILEDKEEDDFLDEIDEERAMLFKE